MRQKQQTALDRPRTLVPEDMYPPMLGQTPAGDDLLIRALVNRLPQPGSNWPAGERQIWLDALRQAFTLIYRDKTS